MRLGELRTRCRDLDNRLVVKLATYDTVRGVEVFDLDFDMCNDGELYLRIVDSD